MRASNVYKGDFSCNRNVNFNAPQASGVVRSSVRSEADQSCRYCYATGHAKWSCPVLKAKSNKRFSGVKPDMLAVSPSKLNVNSLHTGLNSN